MKMTKGANTARAHGVLIVKKLNKCTLKHLSANLFLDRQQNICMHIYQPMYKHDIILYCHMTIDILSVLSPCLLTM